MAEALQNTESGVHELSVPSVTQIGNHGATALEQGLRTNTTLEETFLGENQVSCNRAS